MRELGRRGFLGALGALAANKEVSTRPPYAGDETLFGTECPQCEGMCGTVCEEAIIKFSDKKIPYIDFSVSGCSDCGECMGACEPGVLNDSDVFIKGSLRINAVKCVSWHGVACFSCKDPCLENAIHFENMFRPEIVNDACTLCGYCISRCPGNAIEVIA